MSRKPQPSPQRTQWQVYLQGRAARREWVGEIEAFDEREAIEIAAKEFKQPAKEVDRGATAMTVTRLVMLSPFARCYRPTEQSLGQGARIPRRSYVANSRL